MTTVAFAASCVLHGALLVAGSMYPWRVQSRPALAVLPIELIESIAGVSRETPPRVVPARPLPRRPVAPTAVAHRELPVPPASTPSEELARDARTDLASAVAREEASASSTVDSLPANRAVTSTESAAGTTTRSAQTTDHASPSAIGAVPAPMAAARPPSPAPPRITQMARPGGGYQVRPLYPQAARKAGAEGTTLLRVHVLTDGSIGEVQIERSAGHVALDQAATDAVSKWRFEPARSGPEPVAVWVLIPVEFRLRSGF